MANKDEGYSLAVSPGNQNVSVTIEPVNILPPGPTASTIEMLGTPKFPRRDALATFQSKMPRPKVSTNSSCGWLILLGVCNFIMIALICVAALETSLAADLLALFAISGIAYCFIFCELSVNLPNAKRYTEEEFSTEISKLQTVTPELEAFVDCYHVERKRRGSDIVNVDVSTFTTSETQQFRDFVDVSRNIQFKETGKKRYVYVDMEPTFEPIDERTRTGFSRLKETLIEEHKHRDTLIRVSDAYRIPNMPRRIVIDRAPSKRGSCLMSNCNSRCALFTLCGFPWMVYRNRRVKFLKYQNKKLLSTTAIDEGYKRYIEAERPKLDLVV